MKKRQRSSFGRQLVFRLGGCLFFSMVLIGICLFLDIRETRQRNLFYMERLNEQWEEELKFMVSNVDRMRFLHLIDDGMDRIINGPQERGGRESQVERERYVRNLLNCLGMVNSNVLRATIVTADGSIYGNYVEDSRSSVALAEEMRLYVTESGKNRRAVTDVYEGEINLVPYTLLTLSYPLYPVEGAESLGTIYIDLDFGAMRERFDGVRRQEGWSGFILNGNGAIYPSEDALPEAADGEWRRRAAEIAAEKGGRGLLPVGGRDHVACVKYLEELDWYLVQCVSRGSFVFQAGRGIWVLAFWVILLLCGQIWAGTLAARRISAPIKELALVMSRASTRENRCLTAAECREDDPAEVYEISRGYNALLERIEENIIREYEIELNQKRTELQMLQYQVNPHFLYNTLNAISAIARLYDTPYISEVSESLSRLFSYSVKGGQDAALREELDCLRNYIHIQKVRFPEKFEVSWEVEPGLEACRVPKLLLQPLVENAIDHGIAPKGEKGRIEIRIGYGEEPGTGEILVEDDGVGISEDELGRLRAALEGAEPSRDPEGGIGIRNVHMRVRNYYGARYGVVLRSREGCGTQVRILFPAEGKGAMRRERDRCG